jgi:hypothetical protein
MSDTATGKYIPIVLKPRGLGFAVTGWSARQEIESSAVTPTYDSDLASSASNQTERARLMAVPLGNLPMVVVPQRTVVSTSPHAALLERYVRSCTGRDRSCQVSQPVPSRRGPRGNRA